MLLGERVQSLLILFLHLRRTQTVQNVACLIVFQHSLKTFNPDLTNCSSMFHLLTFKTLFQQNPALLYELLKM